MLKPNEIGGANLGNEISEIASVSSPWVYSE